MQSHVLLQHCSWKLLGSQDYQRLEFPTEVNCKRWGASAWSAGLAKAATIIGVKSLSRGGGAKARKKATGTWSHWGVYVLGQGQAIFFLSFRLRFHDMGVSQN